MSIGDVVMFNSDRISLKVEILDLFKDEGTKYAEVIPAEFPSISRIVPVTKLSSIDD